MRSSICTTITGVCFLLAMFQAHAGTLNEQPPQLAGMSIQQGKLGVQAIIKLSTPVRFVKYTMAGKYSKYLDIYYEHADISAPVGAWSDMETMLIGKTKLTPVMMVNTRDQTTHPKLLVMFDAEMEASVIAGEDGRSFVINFPPSLPADACRYPDSYVQAPSWICEEPVEGWSHTVFSSVSKEQFPNDLAKQTEEATALAREKLGRLMEHGRRFFQVKPADAATDQFGEYAVGISFVPQKTREMVLLKSKVIKSIVGPDGTVYVLVGMND